MSDTQAERTPGTDRPAGYRGTRAAARPSGWVGWVIFAGVVMIVEGAFHIIDGLVALFERGYYAVTSSHLALHVNYLGWGWAHMALGVLFVLVGFGVLAGQTWARPSGSRSRWSAPSSTWRSSRPIRCGESSSSPWTS